MLWRTLIVGFALSVVPAPASAQQSSSELSSSSSAEAPTAGPELSDKDLELAVRAAYNGAAAFAAAHGNYFARDDVFVPLRDAVRAEMLEEGYGAALVPDGPAADLATARQCLASPGTELRIAISTYGDGLSLVAVTDARMFSYDYDPHKAPDIVVAPTADCVKAK